MKCVVNYDDYTDGIAHWR